MFDDWDVGNILKFVFIGVVILSWVGGQVVRVFLRGKQEPRAPGRDRPMPGRQAAGPAGRQQQKPADMGSFLEELRRRSEEQEREIQRQVVDDEEDDEDFEEEPLVWEPVATEPARKARRPLQGHADAEIDAEADAEAEIEATRSAPLVAATAGVSAETRVTDPAVSNLYAAPANFSLPPWISVSDITEGNHLGTILGVTPQKAILLSEIIGPPLALRKRPGGRHQS